MLDKKAFEAAVREHFAATYPSMNISAKKIFKNKHTILIYAAMDDKKFSIRWRQWQDIVFTLEGDGGFQVSKQREAWGVGFAEGSLIQRIDAFVGSYVVHGIAVK